MTTPKVLYVMGTGRTGTTILEILLKSADGVFGVGEVTHIFRDGFLGDRPCSCGSPTSQCAVWQAIRREANWTDHHVRRGEALLRRIESHARFPQLAMGLISGAALRSYGRLNRRLFDAVAAATGANTVVDSSKYAGRALALARTLPDMRVICITRSPAGLIATYRKPNRGEQRRQSAGFVALYYVYVLFCMRIVRSILGSRCLTVRYEDLRSDPVTVLEGIGVWSGIDVTSAVDKVRQGQAFDVGHIVTGNRLRKHGTVRYQTENEVRNVDGMGAKMVARMLSIYRLVLGF